MKKYFCIKNANQKYILGINLKDNKHLHIGQAGLDGKLLDKKSIKLNILNTSHFEYLDKVISLRAKEVF
jgi:hypothetical protein